MKTDKDDDFIEDMRERRDRAQNADQLHNERAADDFRFLIGEHWPDEVRAEREAANQPCLTINAMPQYVRQTTGALRNLNPAIRVIAGDQKASKEVAEIMQGLIRNIENGSDAASIYESAAESAAACGIGYWRLRSDYISDDSFDQEILIERIYNPFAVMMDPQAKHPTRRDAMFCFIVEEVPKCDFEEQYPDAGATAFTSDNKPVWFTQWYSEDTVTVAEYFYIEHEESTIWQLPDGSTSKVDPKMKGLKSRKVRTPKVMWAKVTGDEILEGPIQLPGRQIPVIAVTGEEWHLGEQTYRSSVIRYAKDPQMLYNYAASASAESTALQPKAPYLATAKQIAGRETEWASANSANKSVLIYNHDPAAPPPMRVQPPVSSEAMITAMNLAAEDMKRTTGIYDAGLGARSNETSGKAIDSRKAESQNATSIYADNMVKGVMQTGAQLIDWIPAIYDTRRAVRILGEDDQEKIVVINDLMMTEDGIVPVNDITEGRYDVKIAVGPSYQTRRQESQDGMMEFMRVVPQAAAVTADLVAGMQDWPDADRVAERLRKTLPPGLADDPETDMTPQQMQEKQMQAQQMQAEQQAQQQAQAQTQNIAMREADAKAKKAEADAMKAQAEAEKAKIELDAMNGQIQQHVHEGVLQALQTMQA